MLQAILGHSWPDLDTPTPRQWTPRGVHAGRLGWDSLIATVILGSWEISAPKLLRKMVTNESLAARNLTAASRSQGSPQTLRPSEAYRCFLIRPKQASLGSPTNASAFAIGSS